MNLQSSHPDTWFASTGMALASAQVQVSDAVVSNIYGHHALQLSIVEKAHNLLESSQAICQTCLSVQPNQNTRGSILMNLSQMPFLDESISLIVLHHVHECVRAPEQFFIDLFNMMSPGAILLLLGVNRYGQYGIKQQPAWQRHDFSQHRLRQILSDAGFVWLMTRAVADGRNWVDRLYLKTNTSRRSWFSGLFDHLVSGYLQAFRKPDSIQLIRLNKQNKTINRGLARPAPMGFSKK